MRSEKSWIQQIPGWIEATRGVKVPPGVNKQESLRRAHSMRVLLRDGKISAGELKLDDDLINTFYALCELLENPEEEAKEDVLRDAKGVHRLIVGVTWPDDEFGEREDLLRRCSLVSSLSAQTLQDDFESRSSNRGTSFAEGSPASRWQVPRAFLGRERQLEPEEGWREAERVLLIPCQERSDRVGARLANAEVLLYVCEVLRSRLETTPAVVRAEAQFFYQFLAKPSHMIENRGEREFLMGELAMTAGIACRVLFRREECRGWFDRAEARFVLASNAPVHIARLAYQRLALAFEERRFAEVLELVPFLSEALTELGLAEDAMKCRFLEGGALRETGRLSQALEVFRLVRCDAEARGNVPLTAHVAGVLAQLHRLLGDFQGALTHARSALLLLEQLDNRVGLAKLCWCVGDILREQGKLPEAIEAYREAKRKAEEVGLRADVVAIHLVLAEALLDVGQEREAEHEVRAALPTISEETMVPEGIAAIALLRESVRHRKIDREALRELHKYFPNSE